MQTKVLRILTVLLVIATMVAICMPAMAQGGGGQGGGAGRGGGQGAGGGQGGGGGQGRGGGGRGPQAPPLLMTSAAWEDGGVIPDKYTQKGGQMGPNPELKWSQAPMGTQSFVLLLHDPEPVQGRGAKMDITHWLVWNIPGTSTGLPEGVAAGELPDGTRQLSARSQAYMGMGAPAGPYHHYTFELYALDTKLDVPQPAAGANATDIRNTVINAMDGHVLGNRAVLVARFHQ